MADDRGDEIATFDVSVLVRYADLAVEGLGAAREEIDALNVYPVPDGDTGTNMYLTVESARDQMAERLAGSAGGAGDLRLALASYSRGALLGARGNSGVILSQLIGALIRRIGQAGPDDRTAAVFAQALRAASDAAYAAVGEPVEGTILSVAAAAAEACGQGRRGPGSPARRRDPGRGHRGARGPRPHAGTAGDPARRGRRRRGRPRAVRRARRRRVGGHRASGRCAATVAIGRPCDPGAGCPTGDLTADGPAYEVMYLLDADDDAIPALRKRPRARSATRWSWSAARACGTSTCTSTTSARAVEAGIEAGRPRRDPGDPLRRAGERARGTRSRPHRAGRWSRSRPAPGLEELFAEAGAVVDPRRTGAPAVDRGDPGRDRGQRRRRR